MAVYRFLSIPYTTLFPKEVKGFVFALIALRSKYTLMATKVKRQLWNFSKLLLDKGLGRGPGRCPKLLWDNGLGL